LASEIKGIDKAKLQLALRTKKHRARVLAEASAMDHAVRVQAVPTFFINGRLLQGAHPYEVFARAIDATLRGDLPPPPEHADDRNSSACNCGTRRQKASI
jgi:predicted DsbA family dithiol-disulfide isomerase